MFCMETGLWDADYGFNFLMSSFMNPWMIEHVAPNLDGTMYVPPVIEEPEVPVEEEVVEEEVVE